MRADPGNILNNAFATGAIPVGKVEVDWARNGTWSDISAYVDVAQPGAITYACHVLDPNQGLTGWGQAPMAQCSVLLDNRDHTFSESVSGSPANQHGLYGLPIRVSLGYMDGATPRYVRVHTGTVVDRPQDSERERSLVISSRSGARYRRRKATTVMHRGNQTSTWIAALALAGGISSVALETGLLVIPYAHLDNEYVLDEMVRAAASEGGAVWFDADETLRFANAAHWVARSAVASYTPARMYDVQAQTRWANLYSKVTVTSQPRRSERDTVVYSVGENLSIPPGGSVEHVAEFRWPLDTWTGVEIVAASAGGEDLTASISLSPASPPGAKRWPMIITNSHATQRAYVSKLDVYGKPLSGRPSASFSKDTPGAEEEREWEVPGNWNVQTPAQAEYIVELFSRLMRGSSANRPRPMYVLPNVQGNPLLEPLDVLAVTCTDLGLSAADMILMGYGGRFGGGAYDMDLYLADATGIYAFDRAGFFRPGVSALGTGRMWI
jgi:hypothetical protein